MIAGSAAAAQSIPGERADDLAALQAANNDNPQRKSREPLTILLATATLDSGAPDCSVLDLVRILGDARHLAIVASRGGRLEGAVVAAQGEVVHLDMTTRNPVTMLRNAFRLARIIRTRKCRLVHAHGRSAAWSAYLAARMTGVPFLTSWYKGFRQQNMFKRIYNGVMARGDRIVAVNDQIAELIAERHGTPWDRIVVVPPSIDFTQFDPASISPERIEAVRQAWGVPAGARIVLVTGRMLRRKGHHVVVKAIARLKQAGIKDLVCVFIGEDHGRTRYAGEVWDLVLASDTADVIRMSGPSEDRAAAYAAATVIVSAAVQPEGLQRALLEGLAMARPAIVSDLGAGPDVIQAPPLVPEERMTGLRVPSGDDAALAAALTRLISMPQATRRLIGVRGREWVLANFNAGSAAEQILSLYEELAKGQSQ